MAAYRRCVCSLWFRWIQFRHCQRGLSKWTAGGGVTIFVGRFVRTPRMQYGHQINAPVLCLSLSVCVCVCVHCRRSDVLNTVIADWLPGEVSRLDKTQPGTVCRLCRRNPTRNRHHTLPAIFSDLSSTRRHLCNIRRRLFASVYTVVLKKNPTIWLTWVINGARNLAKYWPIFAILLSSGSAVAYFEWVCGMLCLRPPLPWSCRRWWVGCIYGWLGLGDPPAPVVLTFYLILTITLIISGLGNMNWHCRLKAMLETILKDSYSKTCIDHYNFVFCTSFSIHCIVLFFVFTVRLRSDSGFYTLNWNWMNLNCVLPPKWPTGWCHQRSEGS